jgi:hypothetical protein
VRVGQPCFRGVRRQDSAVRPSRESEQHSSEKYARTLAQHARAGADARAGGSGRYAILTGARLTTGNAVQTPRSLHDQQAIDRPKNRGSVDDKRDGGLFFCFYGHFGGARDRGGVMVPRRAGGRVGGGPRRARGARPASRSQEDHHLTRCACPPAPVNCRSQGGCCSWTQGRRAQCGACWVRCSCRASERWILRLNLPLCGGRYSFSAQGESSQCHADQHSLQG